MVLPRSKTDRRRSLREVRHEMANLALRTAEQHVRNYERESTELMARQHEAMECLDCEAFLQLGIDAFDWLIRADRAIRSGIHRGTVEHDPSIEESLLRLCKAWLGPCENANQWARQQQSRGFVLENLGRFQECCEEMRAIVKAGESGQGEMLPPGASAIRDKAIAEHAHGETAPFV
jgi:hypothetical protein